MTVNERMYALGSKRSEIRELFEYGKKRIAEVGAENVFDFSIGNPSVPAPDCVKEALAKLVLEGDPVALHGYTSAQGDAAVRKACADYINETHGMNCTADDFYMTCGAAASLTVSLNALSTENGEVIVLAPYFPEYKVFITQAGMKCVEVKCSEEDFQIDFAAFEAALNENTKAVIINSPNNPSGAVFSQSTIEKLAVILNAAQEKYGKDIFIIADEPYRELVFTGEKVPYIPCYYENSFVCYSYSKALSLPGERIGYIFVSPTMKDAGDVYAAVCGAGRALGYVCAPSLMQYTIAQCLEDTADISIYERNRKLLYEGLTDIGYTVIKPDGAFYMFVKTLEEDAFKFYERAKNFELLLVPSDDFGCKGFVRISYCVDTKQIENSLPAFKALYEDYKK